MSIDKLQPAPKEQVGVYVPYYAQANKKQILPFAISLHKQGALEGQRNIEGGESIPFITTWNVSSLPADLCRCRMQFDGNAELSYEVMMANYEYIDFLIEVIMNFRRNHSVADFPKGFYRKLLHMDD